MSPKRRNPKRRNPKRHNPKRHNPKYCNPKYRNPKYRNPKRLRRPFNRVRPNYTASRIETVIYYGASRSSDPALHSHHGIKSIT
jgi:hypothetical protein